MTTVRDIFTALEQVLDPELGIGIVPLGLVYDVEVLGQESDRALVTMTRTSPMCPAAPMIKRNVIDALSAVPGCGRPRSRSRSRHLGTHV